MRKPLPRVSLTEAWEFFGGAVLGPDRHEWRKAKCPIHQDRNASASLNEDDGKWFCHTCDKHGDVFDLIQEMEPSVDGLPGAIAFAQEHFAGSGADVPPASSRSSLLPGGSRPGRSNVRYQPPWLRR